MTLAEKIKFYRNKLNLSQEQLAQKCNLSRNAIYNYENNKRTPTVLTLMVIAENLNVSTADILDYKDNASNTLNVIEPSKVLDKCPKDNTAAKKEKVNHHDLDMGELYNKYFLELFTWKTLDMTPDDYLKFILSLYPLNETEHMTKGDFNELSALFYKFLTLIAIKRESIYKSEKNNSNNDKRN